MKTTVLRPFRMHAILQVIADGAGEHAPLDVAALADQVVGRVAMGDRLHVLRDDRPFVEVGGHVMGGRPDQLHAALVRLVIGLGALEAGQERVVDVDAAPAKLAARSSESICM